MKSRNEIETTISDIKIKIQKYTKDLSKAMRNGQFSKQNEFMNEISELQRQEQLLQWVLN